MFEGLTIFQTDSITEVPGLREVLDELGSLVEFEILEEDLPAAFGDLDGRAVTILLSDNVQAVATLATVGSLLLGIIKFLRDAGKHFRIGKPVMKSLVLSKVSEELDADDIQLERARVWGPMVVQPLDGAFLKGNSHLFGLTAEANMIAIAVPKLPKRVRTLWYIMSSDSRLVLSWTTQTFAERVPEFLRPDMAAEG